MAEKIQRLAYLHQTHAAVTSHRESLVVAEARNVDSSLLASLQRKPDAKSAAVETCSTGAASLPGQRRGEVLLTWRTEAFGMTSTEMPSTVTVTLFGAVWWAKPTARLFAGVVVKERHGAAIKKGGERGRLVSEPPRFVSRRAEFPAQRVGDGLAELMTTGPITTRGV